MLNAEFAGFCEKYSHWKNRHGVAWDNPMDAYRWMVAHGYNGSQRIQRIDKTKPLGPDNCHLQSCRTGYERENCPTPEEERLIRQWESAVAKFKAALASSTGRTRYDTIQKVRNHTLWPIGDAVINNDPVPYHKPER